MPKTGLAVMSAMGLTPRGSMSIHYDFRNVGEVAGSLESFRSVGAEVLLLGRTRRKPSLMLSTHWSVRTGIRSARAVPRRLAELRLAEPALPVSAGKDQRHSIVARLLYHEFIGSVVMMAKLSISSPSGERHVRHTA